MKTIGLIGGMSWESSIEYYRVINQTIRDKLGGFHCAKSIMYTVDFAEIEQLQHEGKWDQTAQILITAAKSLEKCGADFILICTNTMHKLADQVQSHIEIPLLHIADATAEKIKARRINSVLLLGTRFTMEEDFYKGRLIQKYDLEVIIPSPQERETVHNVIYNELCMGTIKPASKKAYVDIIERMVGEGAEGVILGCTEIGLLVNKEDSPVPLFDTAEIHARAAVEYALAPPVDERM
ncbi:aspartate/glutamate racemase family protein [Thermodesulfobacteriota bacterium]